VVVVFLGDGAREVRGGSRWFAGLYRATTFILQANNTVRREVPCHVGLRYFYVLMSNALSPLMGSNE
jgi:hypothetical protein